VWCSLCVLNARHAFTTALPPFNAALFEHGCQYVPARSFTCCRSLGILLDALCLGKDGVNRCASYDVRAPTLTCFASLPGPALLVTSPSHDLLHTRSCISLPLPTLSIALHCAYTASRKLYPQQALSYQHVVRRRCCPGPQAKPGRGTFALAGALDRELKLIVSQA
jgi:hypothetical protein